MIIDRSCFRQFFANKKVGVFGFGKTGLSAFNFLKLYCEHIYVWDDVDEIRHKETGINWLSPHDKAWNEVDFVIVSPGLDPNGSISLLPKSVERIADLELFYRLLRLVANKGNDFEKFPTIIGITGTNGKSTTTVMLEHILKYAGISSVKGGNIGVPILDLFSKDKIYEAYVIELSSYQIDLLKDFKCDMSAILNISPDHLGRYRTMENYVASKKRLVFYTNNVCFINIADSSLKDLTNITDDNSTICGVTISYYHKDPDIEKSGDRENCIKCQVSKDKGTVDVINTYNNSACSIDIPVIFRGLHNIQNICFAWSICSLLKVSEDDFIEGLKTFKGLEHRGEVFANSNGISFVNDSKSTNVNSLVSALDCYKNIFLIMGGVPKGESYNPISSYSHVIRKIYLIGEAASLIIKEVSDKIDCKKFETLEGAVKAAAADARSFFSSHKKDLKWFDNKEVGQNINDVVVLLSPGCASFDMFKNFEERGKKFKLLVNTTIIMNEQSK